jgi:cytochrome c peroxidase
MGFPERSRRQVAVALLLAASGTLGACGDRAAASDPAIALQELGRLLFFEPRLSRSSLMSCATCHDPQYAFTDGRTRAIGLAGPGDINTPTLVNVGNRPRLMVTGSLHTLEEQATTAILARGEMGGMREEDVVGRLDIVDGYKPMFREVFGDERITISRIADAIAAFERTIRSRDSDYDRFLEGRATLTQSARLGVSVFFGKGRCAECHSGPDFTDESFHATGSTTGTPSEGRGRHTVTRDPGDAGKIRTPTLREVTRTAPYFHDGSVTDLASVVQFYEQGGRPHPNKSERVRGFPLSDEERRGLLDFLKSLEGRNWIEPLPVGLPP